MDSNESDEYQRGYSVGYAKGWMDSYLESKKQDMKSSAVSEDSGDVLCIDCNRLIKDLNSLACTRKSCVYMIYASALT